MIPTKAEAFSFYVEVSNTVADFPMGGLDEDCWDEVTDKLGDISVSLSEYFNLAVFLSVEDAHTYTTSVEVIVTDDGDEVSFDRARLVALAAGKELQSHEVYIYDETIHRSLALD